MELIIKIFGEGKDLTALQISCRATVVFFIALVLIRISGRRSFGLRTALDNIITISLGAILSRAVVGASAFVPVIVACFVIVLLHRLFGWLVSTSNRFARILEGEEILLYDNGKFISENLKRAQVCREDIMQGIRKSAMTEDINKIDKVYIERTGEISVIKK
jgi:uncharacterized membrane protein YcaP (DUF421 family)